jgi:hypothetical protein
VFPKLDNKTKLRLQPVMNWHITFFGYFGDG